MNASGSGVLTLRPRVVINVEEASKASVVFGLYYHGLSYCTLCQYSPQLLALAEG